MHRPLDSREIDALLRSVVIGHLACTDGTWPYVVPMAYVYHENVVYGQTTEGKKVELLRRNPRVCFQIEKQTATAWQSVLCYGTFEELSFEELRTPDAVEIVRLLTEKIGIIQSDVGVQVPFSFEGGARPLTENKRAATLFRIVLTEKTGRLFSRR